MHPSSLLSLSEHLKRLSREVIPLEVLGSVVEHRGFGHSW